MAPALLAAWSLVDLHNLSGTLPTYQKTIAGLVLKFGRMSAVVAANFYRDERTAAGVAGRFLPKPATPAGLDQVNTAVSWATKGLWSPPKASAAATDASQAVSGPSLELPGHVKNAQTLVKGVAQKMVVDTGRNTLIEAIQADTKARGWAREARPGACHFCALLSTRGAVYRSEETASFEAHDHCHCVPVPVFSAHYEPPAYVRQWNQIYTDHASGQPNPINAFRVALAAHRDASTAPEPARV